MSEHIGFTELPDLLARATFPPAGTPFVCAVSGGADSLALLVLAIAAGCEVTAVHVDHGIRAGSDREAAVVAAVAERFGAATRAERVQVEPGPNLEARLRAARYRVLGPEAATGHTLDDQAETVLINLLRGAGLAGLGAMAPGHRRPILALRRTETAAVCDRLGLDPVVDPSNTDPAFTRNRIRHEAIPLLNAIAGRDVVPLIARTAGHAREVSSWIEAESAPVDPADVGMLRDAPAPVAARALQNWIRDSVGSEHPVDAASVERVLAVVRGEVVAAEVSGGARVSRSAGRLSISGKGAKPD